MYDYLFFFELVMIKEEINKFFGGIFMKMFKVFIIVLMVIVVFVLFSVCLFDKKIDSSFSSKEIVNLSIEVVFGVLISVKFEEFEMVLSDKGNWIVVVIDNVIFDKEVIVVGIFYDKGKDFNDVYCKLVFYF